MRYCFMVETEAHPGRDAELAAWLDQHHIPESLEKKGFVCAERYRVQPNDPGDAPRHIVIYEVETEDLGSVFAESAARRAAGQVSEHAAQNRERTRVTVLASDGPKIFPRR